jgi:lipoyl-dependent peroxiredoxin
MPELTSAASVSWQGGLGDGGGTVSLASGAASALPVSWQSRTEAAGGKTSPEELIAAAHAACFSMALAHEIATAGGTPRSTEVTAKATFVVDETGARVAGVDLTLRGSADGIDAAGFAACAESAKTNCPVSRALAVPITLTLQS